MKKVAEGKYECPKCKTVIAVGDAHVHLHRGQKRMNYYCTKCQSATALRCKIRKAQQEYPSTDARRRIEDLRIAREIEEQA